jgi:hypothetical protein
VDGAVELPDEDAEDDEAPPLGTVQEPVPSAVAHISEAPLA